MNNNQLLSNYYSEHRDEMVNFIAVRIIDVDEARDMVQDIFLRLLRGQQLITPQTLPCLVYTMARHSVADYFRRRRVYEEYEHYIVNSTDSIGEMESLINARQLMERMERSLARLPKACCEIYRLHVYDGMKVSEISEQLNEGYKSVENRLGAARKAIRQYLKMYA